MQSLMDIFYEVKLNFILNIYHMLLVLLFVN